MRPQRGDQDGREQHDRRDQAVTPVALRVQHTGGMVGIGLQEHAIGEDGHRETAPPAEEEAIAQDRRALVVVVGQLRDERGAGYLVQRDEEPHQHRHDDEVREEPAVREPGGRVPQQPVHHRDGQRRRIHERVAASPARVQVVGGEADHRIDHRVADQRQHDAEADPRLGQTEDLVVVEEEEELEAVVLDAERDGPQAVQDLRARAESGARAHGEPRYAAGASRSIRAARDRATRCRVG